MQTRFCVYRVIGTECWYIARQGGLTKIFKDVKWMTKEEAENTAKELNKDFDLEYRVG